MNNKIIFTVFLLITLVSACNSNQNSRNQNQKQVPAENRDVSRPADTRLHQAALDGDKAEVMRLLEKGLNANVRDPDGRSALMYASFNGHTGIVKDLLDNGAEVNICDNYGRTPLMFASSGPFPETVKLLLENRTEPDMADGEEHYTALMYAAAEGHLEVVKVLLDLGADPTLKDTDGDDAVAFALNNGHKDVADLIRSFINDGNNSEKRK